jgi:hypothetical protein
VDHLEAFLLGNHEGEVIKRHHTDPLDLLLDRLNRHKTIGRQSHGRISHAGYTAYIKMQFQYPRKSGRGQTVTQTVWVHHGRGGGAPVTKGMIDSNRIYASRVADVYVIAHKHTSITDQSRYEYCDRYGNIRRDPRDFIIVGGYSGRAQIHDYDNDGYTLNWSDEQHYELEAQGSARVIFSPHLKRERGNTQRVIKRQVIKESA